MTEEERKYYFMRTHLEMSPDEIYRETKIAEVEKLYSLTSASSTYEKKCCSICSNDYDQEIVADVIRYHTSSSCSRKMIEVKYCPNCGRKLGN